jgi:hypothetical protein
MKLWEQMFYVRENNLFQIPVRELASEEKIVACRK